MAVAIEGQPYVVAFAADRYRGGIRSSLLLINPKNGQADQYWFPSAETYNGDIFHMLRADNGCIYTTIGHVFVEFNLQQRIWSFQAPIDGLAMSFVQAPSGKVYFGTYPDSSLWEFDPASRQLRKIGRLDPVEQYPLRLAADKTDWIYAGIGTARNNLVAMNIRTGERRQLIDENTRKIGTGVVYPGGDGQVYARAYASQDSPFFLLKEGQAIATDPAGIQFASRNNIHFQHALDNFPGGEQIKSCSLPDKTLEWADKDGHLHTVKFDYITSGAAISSLIVGNDGNIYGSTNHPMHFWKYDPVAGAFTDYTGIPEVDGGNFPNLVAWKNEIIGPTYSSNSTLYRFDPREAWTKGIGANANPRPLGQNPIIARPRVAHLLRDGHTVVLAGYPGYGYTGGGMVFYDLNTDSAKMLDAGALLPGHSTVALRQLPSGLLVGGTSTEAPGGGQRTAETSLIFHMDPATQKILGQTDIGADVFGLELLLDGNVAGITRDSQLFVYNPQTQEVLSRTDVTRQGNVINAGQALIRDEKGRVYLTLSQSISQVLPNGSIRELVRLPENATSGIAIQNGNLYYATGARLWKYTLPN
nr:hypothetical protein [uncultured bacterium]